MNKFANFIRIALASTLFAALAACGGNGPSQSDAKAAIQARLGDCKYFSIVDFHKINGVPIDDTDYRVEVQYTVNLAPHDGDIEDMLKDYSKMYAELQPIRADYNARMVVITKVHDDIVQAHDGKDPTFSPTAEDARFDDQKINDPQLVRDKAKADELAAKLNANGGVRHFQAKIVQDCPTLRVSRSFIQPFFGPEVTLKQMANGTNVQYTETLAMMKTDNGWQELR